MVRRRKGTDKSDGEKKKKKNADLSPSSSSSSVLIQLRDGERWYEYGQHLNGRNDTIETHPPPPSRSQQRQPFSSLSRTASETAVEEEFRVRADKLFQAEQQNFRTRNANGVKYSPSSSAADERWVESTVHRGTLKDRLAAMSVLVSTDPVHKWYAFEALLQQAGCGTAGGTNSRVAQLAAEALEDLFLNTMIPPDRKLLSMAQRPLHLYYSSSGAANSSNSNDDANVASHKKSLSPRILLLWRFEEMVKQRYRLFLDQYVASTLRHGTESDKRFAISVSAALLREIPEGEATVLQLIVNKLGDTGSNGTDSNSKSAVAAAAAHQLRQVLHRHPAMQPVVAREVQQLAHRPNLPSRALYNCVTFLNQLKLQNTDEYVMDGTTCMTKKAEPSLAASLMKTYFGLFEAAVVRTDRQQDGGKKAAGDEVTSPSAKGKLLSALLTGVNRAYPYLPLKEQSLMNEYVDALYRVAHTATPATSTQALVLLFQVVVVGSSHGLDSAGGTGRRTEDSSIPSLEELEKRRERFYRALYSTLSSRSVLGGGGSGRHLTMFFNLLYRAMKIDDDNSRVMAFAKRLLTQALHCSPSVISSSLILLNEVGKQRHPSLLLCAVKVMRGIDAKRIIDGSKREPRGALNVAGAGHVRSDGNGGDDQNAPLWELALSLHHYHPSVIKLTSLFGSGEMQYSGDPLKDFALMPFLDKFAYRNPKSAERVAEKYRHDSVGGVAERRRRAKATSQTPFNDPRFLQAQSVQAEDEFFHKFFMERARRDMLKSKDRPSHDQIEKDSGDSNDEDDEVIPDDDEDEVAAQTFDELETQWETDSEEEAFVECLAEKIIEDSIDVNGPADLDAEDPDIAGWSDDTDDDDDDDDDFIYSETERRANFLDGAIAEWREDESTGKGASSGEEGMEDAFMDDSDTDSDGNSEDRGNGTILFNGEENLKAFAGYEGDALGAETIRDHDVSDAEADLLFVMDDEKDIDSSPPTSKSKKNKDSERCASLFASVEEYEERINESWNNLERPNRTHSKDHLIIDTPRYSSGEKRRRKHENKNAKQRKTKST